MAQSQAGEFLHGFVDIRRTPKSGDNSTHISTTTNYDSVAHMRTRLAAISAGYYTAARLDQMSVNDMVYALRVSDDAGSIR